MVPERRGLGRTWLARGTASGMQGGYDESRFSMRMWFWRNALVLSIAAIVAAVPLIPRVIHAQRGPGPVDQEDARLPNGKLQRDEILKAEHEQNLKDAASLIEL